MPIVDILRSVLDHVHLGPDHLVLVNPTDVIEIQASTVWNPQERIDLINAGIQALLTTHFTLRGIVIQPSPTQMRGSVGIIAREDLPIPAAPDPDARALVGNMRILEGAFNENFRRFADVIAGGGGGGRGESSSPNMGTAFLTHTGRVTTQPSRPGERTIGRVVDGPTPLRVPIIAPAAPQIPAETPQDLWSLVSEDW